MQTQALVLSRIDGNVALLSLNKPRAMNVVDFDLNDALRAAIQALGPDVRAVVLKAEGPAFSGGGNIRSMQENMATIEDFIARLIDNFHGLIRTLRGLPVPLVVAVNGAAAGGGFSLALTGDLLVAGASAKFVVAYPKLAVSTDGGLSYSLERRLGAQRAQELLLTNATLSADEAKTLGLVTQVVADDQIETAALALAHKVAALPARAVREIKGLFGDAAGLSQRLDAEKAAFLRCVAQDDFRAAVTAFLTPRKG
ncbi:MAG: enoyl-CoA hydratase/isomerase family protein [Proteobacteria bacterium]|nr:enoyl-CoA hydratase/isomerase family protein [Pseudomonadota bacterium]HQR04882.1 enoyl-CoA hydratase-related protein [Rhodocyclaceae bacterium]